MKKITSLLSLLLLLSCFDTGTDSTAPDSMDNNEKNTFAPPLWIHGDWSSENSAVNFAFDANDVYGHVNNTGTSLTEIYAETSIIIETISDTNYTFSATIVYSTNETIYSFSKVNETNISYSFNGGIGVPLYKR